MKHSQGLLQHDRSSLELTGWRKTTITHGLPIRGVHEFDKMAQGETMKKFIAQLVLCLLLPFLLSSCNTPKPAEEVEDAKGRVEKKIQDARDKQESENPENEQESE